MEFPHPHPPHQVIDVSLRAFSPSEPIWPSCLSLRGGCNPVSAALPTVSMEIMTILQPLWSRTSADWMRRLDVRGKCGIKSQQTRPSETMTFVTFLSTVTNNNTQILFLHEQYEEGFSLQSLLGTTQKIKVRPPASAPWWYQAVRTREHFGEGCENGGA